MQKVKSLFFVVTLLTFGFLAACSKEEAYEVVKSECKVTELEDRLQLEFEYELINHSDEDLYFTLVFPSYIEETIISKVGTVKITADSNTSGVIIVSASKNGGELPFIK